MSEQMVYKIVRHTKVPAFHIDDQIATAICVAELSARGLPFEVIEIHPQAGKQIKAFLADVNAVMVDVGRDYDPGMLNFDHHHDSKLSCSAILVAEYFSYGNFVKSDAGLFMSFKDVEGFQAAIAATGHRPQLGNIEGVLNNVDVKDPNVAQAWANILKEIDTGCTYQELLMNLFYGITQVQRDAAIALYEEERELEARVLKETPFFTYKGLKVFVARAAVRHGIFAAEAADIVITPDKTHRHLSVVMKIGRNQELVDFSKSCYELDFIHNGGFTCSLNPPKDPGWVLEFIKSVVSHDKIHFRLTCQTSP